MPQRSNLFKSHWSNQWLTHCAVKERPASFSARLLLGIVLQSAGQPALAADELREAVEIRPDSAVAWYQLGQILSGEKLYTAAIYSFRRAVALNPTPSLSYRIRFAMGIAYGLEGDLNEGIEILARLASADPLSAQTHFELANMCAREGRFHLAVDEYRKAVHLNPGNENAKLALAKALDATKQFALAVLYAQEYIRSFPRDPEGYSVLGLSLKEMARFHKAKKALAQAVQLDPTGFDARYNLGLVLVRLGKISDALDEMEVAEKLKTQDPEVHYQLYRLWRMAGEIGRADEEVQKFRELTQENAQRVSASVLGIKGNELLAAGKPVSAAIIFQQALRLSPNDAKIHYNLSLALSKLGNQRQELLELKKTLSLDPAFAPAHNRLAILYMAKGKDSDAESEFKAAIALNPQFAEAQNNLGVLLGREGKYVEAVKYFRAATQSNPEFAEAYVNWGLIMAQEGKYSKAKAKLHEALQVDPHLADAERALQTIGDSVSR